MSCFGHFFNFKEIRIHEECPIYKKSNVQMLATGQWYAPPAVIGWMVVIYVRE